METFGRTRSITRATIVAIAPALLLIANIWHPYIAGRLPNEAAIAEAVTDDPTRWGFAHLAHAAASAALILAFIAIRGFLRENGDQAWSAVGLGFIVIGSVAYAVLPGMEFAALAAAETDADPQAAQAAVNEWFVPVLQIGGLTFAVGAACVAVALLRHGGLSPTVRWVVVGALLVMAATRLVPLAVAQFYVQSAAALIALWPLAWVIATSTARSGSGTHIPVRHE
jgi:hypothetical protein